FVGSSIAERLLAEGWEVRGVDAMTDYYDVALKEENLARLGGAFTLERSSLLELDLDAALDGVDVVLHQAGQPGVRSSWGEEFGIYLDANVAATQALLEAARRAPSLRRLVYASSSSVYGDAERFPTTELDRPAPISPYGVTKLAAEHLCGLYASEFGVPTVSLRYFTVFGPRQRPDMAFTRFLTAAATDRPVTVFGTGEQVRDFTFVEDVVDANLLAATQDVPSGTVLNIAGGTNVSVNEVLEEIGGLAGSSVEVDRVERSDGDVARTGGDASKAREVLGWEPRVGLAEGLARQWEWVRGRV
ncbi:MAG: NAD-dependent epimerase/dehydratase family protein, partial [Actinomycetales bacterium]|nr:NAD-dependent epimerase/dehydratase family protein [Actinomycetales bacterium]